MWAWYPSTSPSALSVIWASQPKSAGLPSRPLTIGRAAGSDQPEVSQIGAPWALDGYGGRSFTDVVHQDHLHVGVRAVPVD